MKFIPRQVKRCLVRCRESKSAQFHCYLLVFLAIALVPVALYLATVVGESFVDVGLDVMREPAAPPVLAWGSGQDQSQAMEKISERFSPARQAFEVIVRGEKRPEAKGAECELGGFPLSKRLEDQPQRCLDQQRTEWGQDLRAGESGAALFRAGAVGQGHVPPIAGLGHHHL